MALVSSGGLCSVDFFLIKLYSMYQLNKTRRPTAARFLVRLAFVNEEFITPYRSF